MTSEALWNIPKKRQICVVLREMHDVTAARITPTTTCRLKAPARPEAAHACVESAARVNLEAAGPLTQRCWRVHSARSAPSLTSAGRSRLCLAHCGSPTRAGQSVSPMAMPRPLRGSRASASALTPAGGTTRVAGEPTARGGCDRVKRTFGALRTPRNDPYETGGICRAHSRESSSAPPNAADALALAARHVRAVLARGRRRATKALGACAQPSVTRHAYACCSLSSRSNSRLDATRARSASSQTGLAPARMRPASEPLCTEDNSAGAASAPVGNAQRRIRAAQG
ncbi:hypothetical protein B0H10DRAFT_2239804 [Mycena sp. CBHHK59/15]|nr:hypothetical protein B0H10DRAFT_2239804 [Mycena sp. CBHHK59/15]